MKKTPIILSIMLTAGAVSHAKENLPRFGRDSIESVVKAMTLDEKINLVVGTFREYIYNPPAAPGMPVREAGQISDERAVTAFSEGRVAGAAGDSYVVPRLGIPAIVMADGPAGVRIDPTREGDEATYYCTAFPTGSLLAAGWDVETTNRVGAAIGDEALHYGVDILLAPGLNIMRSPLCGRNFEYYSEDPLLAGKMAAAYVNGVQSNGVGATVKHFAANNQETMRNGIDVVISDRALREIYLEPFRIAVTEAHPMAVMSSYNKVNGVIMPENEYLLTDVLRGEWGFDGFVMTDWWGEGSGDRQTVAGNDMLMPGTWRQYDEIKDAVEDGTLPVEYLDRNVANILRAFSRTPAGSGRRYDNRPDLETHAGLARQAASQGFVLLENRADVLPLAGGKRIALFGNQSYDTYVGGSGSGNVNRAYKVNIDQGLVNAGYSLDSAVGKFYADYLAERQAGRKDDFWTVARDDEPMLRAETVAEASKANDVAVITISRMAGEGGDRTLTEGDWFLSDAERSNIENITEAFHREGKPVVVLLNMGTMVDMADWKDLPDAILHVWLPGQEAGNAVADALTGVVNPSGRLPFTIARKYEDYGSAANFPHSENPATVYYTDDIFVGYRHFDRQGIEPLYPFGYGLSYTQFAQSEPVVTEEDGVRVAVVEVTNTGDVPGADVVVVMSDVVDAVTGADKAVSTSNPRVECVRNLVGFGKTRVLQPGETQTLRIALKKD